MNIVDKRLIFTTTLNGHTNAELFLCHFLNFIDISILKPCSPYDHMLNLHMYCITTTCETIATCQENCFIAVPLRPSCTSQLTTEMRFVLRNAQLHQWIAELASLASSC